jgi:GNAT superfamily N-acetyltransferase
VRLPPDDWMTFRELRLVALAEAPLAFGSTVAEERQLDERDWRARLAQREQLAVRLDDALAGTAGLQPCTEEAGAAELVSMWVAPHARGRGVGDALVRALLERAAEHGYDVVRLWLSEGNRPAEQLYARHGFVPANLATPPTRGLPRSPTRYGAAGNQAAPSAKRPTSTLPVKAKPSVSM